MATTKKFDPLYGLERWLWVPKNLSNPPQDQCYEYVRWQNRATNFYCAARLLHFEEVASPAAFCAFQAIENILKATIAFYKSSKRAEEFGHKLRIMERYINNQIVRKLPNAEPIRVPDIFVDSGRFRSVSRYPKTERGTSMGSLPLEELDRIFFKSVVLVPYQSHTELFLYTWPRHPKPSDLRKGEAIRRENSYFEPLRSYLKRADEQVSYAAKN